MHEEAHEAFVTWARGILRAQVGEVCARGAVTRAHEAVVVAISEDALAYKAAVLMRRHKCDWLVVHDRSHQTVGYIDEGMLGDVMGLVDAGPYLGEAMMAQIVPSLEIADVRHA